MIDETYNTPRRQGSALVLTMGVMMIVFSLLALAGQRMSSLATISKVDFAVQQAAAAAEAVTSFRETELVELAAANEPKKLLVNPDTGSADDPWEGMEWFGDCIVRWRVEPVRVMVGAENDGQWIANPPIAPPGEDAQSDIDDFGNAIENREFFHFRIISEAYYLRNVDLVKGVTLESLKDKGELPWQKATNGIANVRASRIIQMRINSLFKYALFHAQEGPNGDIEMGPGTSQSIQGRVHSNGAIYIAGGGKKTSTPTGWGPTQVGAADNIVDMVGINGIFRFRKDSMLLSHRRKLNPIKVPESGDEYSDAVKYGDGSTDPSPFHPEYGVTLTSVLNDTYYQNDNTKKSRHTLNGIDIYPNNDSRTPGKMQADFSAQMRDGVSGSERGDGVSGSATVVRTLSNIPEMGGRPFEPQALFAEGTQIWTTNPDDPSDVSFWTVVPNDPPANYYVDPEGVGGGDFNFTDTPSVTAKVVVNYARRLYYQGNPRDRNPDMALSGYLNSDNPSLDVAVVAQGLEDNAGFLVVEKDGVLVLIDGSPVTPKDEWMVDAAGLRQYYQRNTSGTGAFAVNGNVEDGDKNVSRNVIDIFDVGDMYDGNPSINPASSQPSSIFSYHASSKLDDGTEFKIAPSVTITDVGKNDSFGDNEVQGVYLKWALEGKDNEDKPESERTYGLVIRERRYQNIPTDAAEEWTNMPNEPTVIKQDFPTVTVEQVVDTKPSKPVDATEAQIIAWKADVKEWKKTLAYYITADAIRWVKQGDLLEDPASQNATVENDNDGFTPYRFTQTSQASSAAVSHDGVSYYYTNKIETSSELASEVAKWTLDKHLDGTYELWAWQQPIPVKLTGKEQGRVAYIISGLNAVGNHESKTYTFDQKNASSVGEFKLIGTFKFSKPSDPAPLTRNDYINYLVSQYVVYFGPYDITRMFFSYGYTGVATEPDMTHELEYEEERELICSESQMLDRREATFMQFTFLDQDSTMASDEWHDYKVSVLNINMKKVMGFLKNADFEEVKGNSPLASNRRVNKMFNGLVYAHRTRRSASYTPWSSARWHPDCYGHWVQDTSVNYELPPDGRKPWKDATPEGTYPTAFDWRTGSGPAMTFHSAVRLYNASDLDYGINYVEGADTTDTSDDYVVKKGLTFVTPGMCYVHGDYNTEKYQETTVGDETTALISLEKGEKKRRKTCVF